MHWRQYVRDQLSRQPGGPDEGIVEELALHAEAAVMAARADGATSADADAHVRQDVDRWCTDAARRPLRSKRPVAIASPPSSTSGAAGFALDIRYGLRVLRRRPGFALLTVLTMTLGIAAVTTLFAVAYGVLLKPLPWPDANRLVIVTETHENAKRQFPLLTNASYLSWQASASTIEGLAAYGNSTVTIANPDGSAERVQAISATASLFTVLGARPALGSAFTADQERPGSNQVVVISYGLWQRVFGGRQDVVGRTAMLSGESHTIVGVMPKGFAFPDPTVQLWTPKFVTPVDSGSNGKTIGLFNALARLKPNATAQQASDEATARSRSGPDLGMVGIAVFGSNGATTVSARPMIDAMTADIKAPLALFLVAVVLLFVTAVANIASMQLARAAGRRREVAIRSAIGASGARIAMQLLIENTIVGLTGGVTGLALSLWLRRELPRLLPADFPRLSDVAVDWRVVAVAIGLSLGASLVFGLLPAMLARRVNLVEALVEDSLAPVGGSFRSGVARMRAAIMTGQVAVAAVLLVGAALLIRSFMGLAHVDRGYDPSNLLTAQVPLGSEFTGVSRAQLLDQVLERISRVPGVTHAGVTSIMPLVRAEAMAGFTLPPRPGIDTTPIKAQASPRVVSPDYFAAMGMRFVGGRSFTDADTLSSRPALIVNQTFARAYLVEPVVGSTIQYGLNEGQHDAQIIGLVDDVRQQNATDPPKPEMFMDYRQLKAGMAMSMPSIVVRTSGDPSALTATLRAIVREQNPAVALDGVMTMAEKVRGNLARPRLYAVLLGGLAGFTLLIAGVGLFGVLSYAVSQRVREIGVRTALGATPLQVIRLVVAQGAGVTAIGTAVGLAAAYTGSRYVSSFLFGIETHDLISFALVPVVLLVVGAIACVVPARRAARVDPLRALRGQ
jgi:putative ABC transport system permease protein